MKAKLIGYWGDGKVYPDPKVCVWEDYWDKHEFEKRRVVEHLIQGCPCNKQRGWANCKICGAQLGTFERTDGDYVWPDRLEHYVIEHNVMLPLDFIKYCSDYHSAYVETTVDEWVSWGHRHMYTNMFD